MQYELATRQVVQDVEVSPSVSMDGANAIQVEATVFSLGTASAFVILVQLSNDNASWVFHPTAATVKATIGYTEFSAEAITSRYVRLVYTPTTSGSVIFAVGVNTADL